MPAVLKKEESQSSIVIGEMPTNETPMVQVKNLIDKKIRNLEKRKTKLEQYKSDLKDGKVLIEEQMKAVERYDDVEQQLELVKEIQKGVNQVFQDHKRQQKTLKQTEYRDQCELEMSKIRQLLSMQEILDVLGKDTVRQLFVSGTNGAIKLTNEELNILDEIYQKICPTRDDLTDGQSWTICLQESAQFVHSLLNCSSKNVLGKQKTFKELRTLLDKVATCEYFNNKISRCQSPEQVKSETSSVNNDDCNGATLQLDEISHVNQQTSNLIIEQNDCNQTSFHHQSTSLLPSHLFSPAKPTQPAMIFIQDKHTGALCNTNFMPPMAPPTSQEMNLNNFLAPVESTTAFNLPHHPLPNGAEVINANPLAYCSNGQESLAFIYAQQQPYVTLPPGAFVDTYAHGYQSMASMEQQCQTSPHQIIPGPYSSASSKSLDPNAPTFVSRAVNWIPVIWPNHTIHPEISLDDANLTYDALQGIVEIGQKAEISSDGSFTTAANLTTFETDLTATKDDETTTFLEEEIVDPSIETTIESFNEMNLSAEMFDNQTTSYCNQMSATMYEPVYSQPSVLQPYWYNYGLQTFGAPCV